jgi:predicted XRE-type DNA-binding protein
MKTTSTTHEVIYELAVKATAGTLKRVYDASGNDTIRVLRSGLQSDIHHSTNSTYISDSNIADQYVISDASDLLMIAYTFLYQKIVVEGMNAQDTEVRVLKNGKEKVRTVFQWACIEVRKAIYAEKAIENSGKYAYIEDLRSDDESSVNALDRHYIRLKKYYDLGSEVTSSNPKSSMDGVYTANFDDNQSTEEMVAALCLTDRQKLILHYRMQGLSVTQIAEKLKVSKPAISKTMAQIQAKVKEHFPESIRAFKK